MLTFFMIRRRSTPQHTFYPRSTTHDSATFLRVHAGNAANPFLSYGYFITCGHPGAGGRTVNQISGEEICPDERSEEGPLFPSDEAFLSRATLRSDGPLCHPDQEICPDERSEEGPLVTRDDLRFRPRQAGALFSDSGRRTKDKSGQRSPRFGCRRRCFAPGDSGVAERVAYIRPRL
jgi:hypothetical protein